MAAFRDECQKIGRAYHPEMVGATRGLQIVRNEGEREKALEVRYNVLKNIGGLARGPGAARYSNLKDESGPPIEFDDAPLLGTPKEIVARLKKLEAGGVEHVLLVDPRPSVERLRIFASEIMPEFATAKATA